MKGKENNQFIDNNEFLDLIIKYQDKIISKQEEDKLGKIILSLVNHFAMKPNFSNYSYLDEMKSNAFFTIWKNLDKFNRNKSDNPFSYYTQACYHAFIFVINKEKLIDERRKEHMLDTIERLENQSEVGRLAKKKFTSEIKDNKFIY